MQMAQMVHPASLPSPNPDSGMIKRKTATSGGQKHNIEQLNLIAEVNMAILSRPT